MARSPVQTLTDSQLAAAARLFSSTVVQQLARRGRSALFARLVAASRLATAVSPAAPIRDLFDLGFTALRRSYRDEYVYRSAIAHNILFGVHSLKTSSMLSEFRVGACKADVVILNGTSTAYEIKSDRDKLDRLTRQLSAYLQVFAQVHVITAEKQVHSVAAQIPTDVGILVLKRRGTISTVRHAIENRARVLPTAVFDSLQRHESRRILERAGVAIPRVPNTQIHTVQRDLFSRLTPEQAHDGMVHVLKETRSHLAVADLIRSLPRSLQASAMTTNLRRRDHDRLLGVLQTPVREALSWA